MSRVGKEEVSKSIKHQQLSLFQKLSTTSHHLSNNQASVLANKDHRWSATVLAGDRLSVGAEEAGCKCACAKSAGSR